MSTSRSLLGRPLVIVGLIGLAVGGVALWQSSLFLQCGPFDRAVGHSGCVARITPEGWNPPTIGGAAWPTADSLAVFDNVPADWPGEDHSGPVSPEYGGDPERWVDLVTLDPMTGAQTDRVRLPIAVAAFAHTGMDGTQAVLASGGMFASTPAGGNDIAVSTIDGSVLAMPATMTIGMDHDLIGDELPTYEEQLVPGVDDRIVRFNDVLEMPLALFDRETGAKIHDFGDSTFGYGDPAPMYTVHLHFEISADGNRLALIHTNPPASVGAGAVIRVWDITDGTELASFHLSSAFDTGSRPLVLSPDGSFVGVRTYGPDTRWPILGGSPSHGIHIFRVPEPA